MAEPTSTPATGADEAVDKPTLRKAITGSAVGNATEWFDYGAYAYLATELTANFFPEWGYGGTAIGFAVSFVLRPLGGFFWGPLGDRIGRQKVLAMTIILMAAATFLLGCLPTFETFGWGAVVLLISLRIVQGFSTGGEYGGAATFMAEYAPDKKRGFYGSFLEFGTLGGFTAAIALVFFLRLGIGDQAMEDWGWRIPFWVGGVVGLVGLYIRTKLEDTPVFRELEEKEEVESGAGAALRDLMSLFWKPILTLIGLVAALNMANYTLLTYMPQYLQNRVHFSAHDAELMLMGGHIIMMIFLPFAGSLSDRVGRKPMWAFSFIGLAVLAVPMFLLIGAGGFGPAILGYAVLGIVYAAQLATISATFPAMFPSSVRYGGVAIGYNIGAAVFGGTAPLVNDALIDASGDVLMPAYYMIAASVIGLIALYFTIETAGKPIRGTEIPGTPEHDEEVEKLEAEAAATAPPGPKLN